MGPNWESLGDEPLGQGGQGRVDLVKLEGMPTPEEAVLSAMKPLLTGTYETSKRPLLLRQFSKALNSLLAGDHALGAKKQLLNPDEESRSRLKLEAQVYESISSPHLLRILDKNLEEDWIVTEYQPFGTLESRLGEYRGDALASLKGIRPLVDVLSQMHKLGFVHRDFKPGNIFLGRTRQLVLGDAGLAFYIDNESKRVTKTYESVGTQHYMPAWAYGRRLKEIKATFDVFSVGKVIWAMIAGEETCPLWRIDREEFDLAKLFPKEEEIVWVNQLLRKCVVEWEEDMKIQNGGGLLEEIDAVVYRIVMHAVPPSEARMEGRTCRLCFSGTYQIENRGYAGGVGNCLRCDRCGHLQFFMDPPLEQ